MSDSSFFRGKSVLITGASSGIGRTLALQLGAAGAKVTLSARRTELLATLADEMVASGAVRPVISACDVTREGDPERAVATGRAEAIVTGHGKLLVAIERFAPWILRAAARRMAARGRGHRTEVDTH